MTTPDPPQGLALYLVYQDVAAICDWLVRCLRFVETGRKVGTDGVVTNAELLAGPMVLLLEHGDVEPDAYPRGVRWAGVWVDDPDSYYRRLSEMSVDARPRLDEPWGVRLAGVVDPEATPGPSSSGRSNTERTEASPSTGHHRLLDRPVTSFPTTSAVCPGVPARPRVLMNWGMFAVP